MKVFVTGATGYIGTVVAEKLQAAGHRVAGLARSDASAEALAARGIESVRGELDSLPAVAAAARAADGVIHTAFDLGGGDFAAAIATEAKVVRAFIDALQGADKPLVITSGTAVLGDTGDRVFDEETPIARPEAGGQADAENQGMKSVLGRLNVEDDVLNAAGIRGTVLRPPSVYGRSDGRSILTWLRAAGRALGAVPFAAGTADHKWSLVHVDDLADLYVLALEKAKGGELFHAGAEAGLRTRGIAEAVSHSIGLGGKTVELEIPELAKALGMQPMAEYWSLNGQSSGEKARRLLGWEPKHVRMLAEIAQSPA